MIRRQVDDQPGASLELGEALSPVREREEQDVDALDVVVADEREVRALPEVRMGAGDRLARQRGAARHDLAHLGVREEEAQELTAGIARGADDAGPQAHDRLCSAFRPTSSTKSTILAGMFTPVVSMELRNSIV